ncbi:MAG: 30S ribosomal protein S1 [Fimbriimonadaceae bacterium]|nr:30S ribosomal protein S1 [Fimbriimonadaceae bacterium]
MNLKPVFGYILAARYLIGQSLCVHVMTVNEEQTASPTPEETAKQAETTVAAVAPTSNEAPAPVAPEAPAQTPEAAPQPADAAPTEPIDPNRPAVEVADDSDLFDQWLSNPDQAQDDAADSRRRLNRGDLIEATVIQVAKDRVFVDLGTKSEGEIPLNELTDENVDTAEGLVNVGDKIKVVVIRHGRDGSPVVSKKQADFDEAWLKIVEAFKEGTMLTAPVVERVKGGLVVDIGVRGFVPATHVGNGKIRNLDRYVGEPIELKVLELDKERKKVVLSNRDAEEKRRDELRDKVFTEFKPGDIVEGTVRRLADYGAFVDLGGIDGLLHISEMSWMRINHPREVLKEGDDLKVMVLKLDKDNGKISLGLRQVLPDPWNQIKENYTVGQKLNVTITRMVQSGAFVKLPEGAEAFLPISEISHQRINKPQDVLTDGQEVELTVIDLRPDERRMVLSLKHGTEGGEQIGYGYGGSIEGDYEGRGAPRDRHRKPVGKKGGKGQDYGSGGSGGGATIGERLGMLKGFHFRSEEDEAAPAPAEETPKSEE